MATDLIRVALDVDQSAQLFGGDFARLDEWLDDQPSLDSDVQEALVDEGHHRDTFGDLTTAQVLGVNQRLRQALLVAAANLDRMIFKHYGGPEHCRYHEAWDAEEGQLGTFSFSSGSPFGCFASCQGGHELQLIYQHPTYGAHPHRLSPDQYRRASAPYVAAFRTELMPGNTAAGLVAAEQSGVLDPFPVEGVRVVSRFWSSTPGNDDEWTMITVVEGVFYGIWQQVTVKSWGDWDEHGDGMVVSSGWVRQRDGNDSRAGEHLTPDDFLGEGAYEWFARRFCEEEPQ